MLMHDGSMCGNVQTGMGMDTAEQSCMMEGTAASGTTQLKSQNHLT